MSLLPILVFSAQRRAHIINSCINITYTKYINAFSPLTISSNRLGRSIFFLFVASKGGQKIDF